MGRSVGRFAIGHSNRHRKWRSSLIVLSRNHIERRLSSAISVDVGPKEQYNVDSETRGQGTVVRLTLSNFANVAFVQQTQTHGDNTGRVQGQENSGCVQEDKTGCGKNNGRGGMRQCK
jgi:hypothetical protein